MADPFLPAALAVARRGLRLDLDRVDGVVARWRQTAYPEASASWAPVIESIIERARTSPDGCVRPVWNPDAGPGRMVASGLPIQSTPKPLRACFVPPPGCLFVGADIVASHLCIAGVLSGDQRVQYLALQLDPWAAIAAAVLPGWPPDVAREAVKACTLAILNGAKDPQSLVKDARKRGVDLTVDQAQHLVRDFWAALPELAAWRDSVKDIWTFTTPAGRTVTIPEDRRDRTTSVEGAWRLQAAEADGLRATIVEAERQRAQGGPTVVLPMFDGLLAEAPAEAAQTAAQQLGATLAGTFHDLGLGVRVKTTTGATWGDLR